MFSKRRVSCTKTDMVGRWYEKETVGCTKKSTRLLYEKGRLLDIRKTGRLLVVRKTGRLLVVRKNGGCWFYRER